MYCTFHYFCTDGLLFPVSDACLSSITLINFSCTDGSSSLGPGGVAGIVFAVVALVLLAAVVALVIYRREQWKKYAGAEGKN